MCPNLNYKIPNRTLIELANRNRGTRILRSKNRAQKSVKHLQQNNVDPEKMGILLGILTK